MSLPKLAVSRIYQNSILMKSGVKTRDSRKLADNVNISNISEYFFFNFKQKSLKFNENI